MSALGQKPTCAPQKVMSALHPIATAKADSRNRPCPLYPQKQTCAVQTSMSALGQKQTFRYSFDHLVDAVKQRRRHGEAERLSGFEVDDQPILGRRLHWQVGRLLH